MRIHNWVIGAVGALAVLAFASPSSAATVLSFGYTDMSGDFAASSFNTGVFTAQDDEVTNGDVTRIIGAGGTALFAGNGADGGFPAPASVDILINIADVTDATATGFGAIRMTDLNGDYIEAGITGLWLNIAGAGNFNGAIVSVDIVDNSGDNTFDGTSGSFSLDNLDAQYTGNIQTLTFQDWFNNGVGGPASDFGKSNTLVQGAIVPEPATLALLGLGGLAVLARRRRQ